MRNFLSILAVGVLAAVSCDKPMPVPGTIYEITFPKGRGTGVAVFETAGEQMTGIYYADEGKIYANPKQVTLIAGGRSVKMEFAGGEKKRFTFKPYKAPAYPVPELDEVILYRDSVYAVDPLPEEVEYGKEKGYWTSYPEVCHKSFGDVFKERYGMVLDGREDCPLTMDIYKPVKAGVESRPLFLMIHGGAFYYEDKADPEYAAWCRYFASLGYVAASINYRMGFELNKNAVQRAGYQAVQDAHAAIRYLLVHRKDLHIDPQRVFLAGNSAGAMIALSLAFMEDETRPTSTQGGRVFKKINDLLGTSIRDLGPIDAVNPSDSARFTIKAVANMWGAVLDPAILESRKVAIISFHSLYDPTVNIGYDYPFRDYIQEDLFDFVSDGSLAKKALDWWHVQEKVNHVVFEKMYGSQYIHQKATSLGYHSELYKYPDFRHSLHVDENCLPLHFYEIEHRIADFFAREMEDHPVELHLDENDNRWIRIDPTDVNRCYWKIEGGVVRETARDGIRVLIFRDAENRSVTVHGDYRSEATFKEEMEL